MKIEFINVGRQNICKVIEVKNEVQLHKEIDKYIMSAHFDLEETETPNLYNVSAGFHTVGQIKILKA